EYALQNSLSKHHNRADPLTTVAIVPSPRQRERYRLPSIPGITRSRTAGVLRRCACRAVVLLLRVDRDCCSISPALSTDRGLPTAPCQDKLDQVYWPYLF